MEINFEHWSKSISIIRSLSEALDKQWIKRFRKIDTFFIIIFITRLLISKSKTGYQIIINEIWEEFKKNNIEPPQEKSFAQSSVCEARQKLNPKIILELTNSFIHEFFKLNENKNLWHGFRVFAVDGSWIMLPSELKKEGYGRREDMYDATGHLSCLYHIGTGVVLDTILDNNGDERKIALQHFIKLKKGDVIVYDRGYFGYDFALEHINKGIHFIMRVDKGNVPIEIENFIKNSNSTCIIITEIKASKHLVSRSLKKGYDIKNTSIKIKLIKYKIECKEYYLATSILDNEISQSNFAEIYHKRWEVEEHYKLKKSILDIQHFHSKSEKGILQEIYCSALIINIS
jgi:hypothetical protein